MKSLLYVAALVHGCTSESILSHDGEYGRWRTIPLSDEEAEQALLFALRPDGLVNSGEEIYRAMDQNFEGKSQMIPVEISVPTRYWGILSGRRRSKTAGP